MHRLVGWLFRWRVVPLPCFFCQRRISSGFRPLFADIAHEKNAQCRVMYAQTFRVVS